MRKITHKIWKIVSLLFVITGTLTINIEAVVAQEGSVFTDQMFNSAYTMAVHWDASGNRTFAVSARPSSNIFILDNNFNEIASFDPFSDTTIPDRSGGVVFLDWNSTGAHLAATINETLVGDLLQIWDVNSGTFESFSVGRFVNATWSPQGNFLAIRTEGSVIIWDVENQVILHELILPGAPVVQYMAWKSDGSQIAALNVQGVLRIWDVTTANIVMELNADNALLSFDEIVATGNPSYWSAGWEPNSNSIAVFDSTNLMIEIWDTVSQTLVTSFPIQEDTINIRWGISGFATNAPREAIKLWDIATGTMLQEINLGEDESFQFITWHPTEPELFYALSAPNMDFQDLIHTVPV